MAFITLSRAYRCKFRTVLVHKMIAASLQRMPRSLRSDWPCYFCASSEDFLSLTLSWADLQCEKPKLQKSMDRFFLERKWELEIGGGQDRVASRHRSWQMWHHMSSLANYSHDTNRAGRRAPSEDQCFWFSFLIVNYNDELVRCVSYINTPVV